MKNITYILLTGLAIVCLTLFFLNRNSKEETPESIEQIEAELLKKEYNQLLKANQFLDDRVSRLKTKVDSLTGLITKDEFLIKKLKEQQDEKIDKIKELTKEKNYLYFSEI